MRRHHVLLVEDDSVIRVTLAHGFHARWPHLPVVFVTGRPDALLGFRRFRTT